MKCFLQENRGAPKQMVNFGSRGVKTPLQKAFWLKTEMQMKDDCFSVCQ